MIPARYGHIVFSALLSAMMSFIVSGFSLWRAVGFTDGLPGLWLGAWLGSWAIAFPAVLVVAPIARRLVARLVAPPPAAEERRQPR